MKQIIKWVAEDGTEFINQFDCVDYEDLCNEVIKIMTAFPPIPENDGCSFSNGEGYLQLSEETVTGVRNKLLDIISTKIEHRWVEESRDIKIHPSYVARLLGDYGIRPLEQAWNRLCKIDNQYREWGQPYFAINPEKGKQIMLATVLI